MRRALTKPRVAMSSSTRSHSLPTFLRDAMELAGQFAAATAGAFADVAANNLCASASSSSSTRTVDYLAMVEHGVFDGYLITRVAHCASPIQKTGNLLEHEFVVIEAKNEGGRVRFFSLEKVNRGAGQTSVSAPGLNPWACKWLILSHGPRRPYRCTRARTPATSSTNWVPTDRPARRLAGGWSLSRARQSC